MLKIPTTWESTYALNQISMGETVKVLKPTSIGGEKAVLVRNGAYHDVANFVDSFGQTSDDFRYTVMENNLLFGDYDNILERHIKNKWQIETYDQATLERIYTEDVKPFVEETLGAKVDVKEIKLVEQAEFRDKTVTGDFNDGTRRMRISKKHFSKMTPITDILNTLIHESVHGVGKDTSLISTYEEGITTTTSEYLQGEYVNKGAKTDPALDSVIKQTENMKMTVDGRKITVSEFAKRYGLEVPEFRAKSIGVYTKEKMWLEAGIQTYMDEGLGTRSSELRKAVVKDLFLNRRGTLEQFKAGKLSVAGSWERYVQAENAYAEFSNKYNNEIKPEFKQNPGKETVKRLTEGKVTLHKLKYDILYAEGELWPTNSLMEQIGEAQGKRVQETYYNEKVTELLPKATAERLAKARGDVGRAFELLVENTNPAVKLTEGYKETRSYQDTVMSKMGKMVEEIRAIENKITGSKFIKSLGSSMKQAAESAYGPFIEAYKGYKTEIIEIKSKSGGKISIKGRLTALRKGGTGFLKGFGRVFNIMGIGGGQSMTTTQVGGAAAMAALMVLSFATVTAEEVYGDIGNWKYVDVFYDINAAAAYTGDKLVDWGVMSEQTNRQLGGAAVLGFTSWANPVMKTFTSVFSGGSSAVARYVGYQYVGEDDLPDIDDIQGLRDGTPSAITKLSRKLEKYLAKVNDDLSRFIMENCVSAKENFWGKLSSFSAYDEQKELQKKIEKCQADPDMGEDMQEFTVTRINAMKEKLLVNYCPCIIEDWEIM